MPDATWPNRCISRMKEMYNIEEMYKVNVSAFHPETIAGICPKYPAPSNGRCGCNGVRFRTNEPIFVRCWRPISGRLAFPRFLCGSFGANVRHGPRGLGRAPSRPRVDLFDPGRL